MALQLASPGISVREVDLTRGGVNATLNVAAGIAAPFKKGPVNEVVRIINEKELVEVFGGPGAGLTDYHYESWYAASNFLSYGGQLDVVRAGGGELNNANAGVGIASTTSLRVDNFDDYNNNHSSDTSFYWAAKNPGFWAENVKVCVIDAAADQRISGVLTTAVGVGTTVVSHGLQVGYAVTQALSGTSIGVGTFASASGYLKGVITGVGASFVDVKVVSYVSNGTETKVDYQANSLYQFTSAEIGISSSTLGDVGFMTGTKAPTDWYDQQNVLTSVADGGSDAVTVSWRSVLAKPGTNSYVAQRNGRNDALNVVVIDASGSVTGVVGSILEKFGNLSKAKDAEVSPQKSVYYKDYLAVNSQYIYAGLSPVNATDAYWGTRSLPGGFSSGVTAITASAGSWGQEAKDITFSSLGNATYRLTGGKDYQGVGYYDAPLGDLLTAYDKLSDPVNGDIGSFSRVVLISRKKKSKRKQIN